MPRRRVFGAIVSLCIVNLAVWCALWCQSTKFPFLLAAGWLAYAFGLRHAVDADHIAAIDNTTRKLMRDGKRPIGVGSFFSLGHSTVVLLLCAALASATAYAQRTLPSWKTDGAVAGTVISGAFLYLIGLVNLIVLVDLIFKAQKRVRAAPTDRAEDIDIQGPGLLVRLLRPVLLLVRHSWQMYLVGFLFGLGFDTASEVGILAISARGGQSGVSFWVIMLLPALFTAGMCLVDTLDGILMLGAYGWAFNRPDRKINYNLVITSVSVLVAFAVGTHEILGMAHIRDLPHTAFWSAVDSNLGFVIVGLFASVWAIAAIAWKTKASRESCELA